MVQSERTGSRATQTNALVSDLGLSLFLSSSLFVHAQLWMSLTFWQMSTIRSPFSSQFVTSNFSSIRIVLCWFFTSIALGDTNLCLSPMLIRNVSVVEEETTWAVCLFHQCNQSVHVTDGVTVTSLFTSLLQKISTDVDCLCQIALNRKFYKF